jgi:hypothetical protein
MSLSSIWDRFWWSMILTIMIGLLWLKFLDPIIPCVSVGLASAVVVGLAYFSIGMRALLNQKKLEEEIERKAIAELREDMEGGPEHG